MPKVDLRPKKRLTYLSGTITVDFNEHGKFTAMYLNDALCKNSWKIRGDRGVSKMNGVPDDIILLFQVLDAIKEEIGLDLLAAEAEKDET